jgi:general secretion pathway protein F
MQYVIKALRGNEGMTELLLEAADAADAEVQAILQGYSVIAIKARKQWTAILPSPKSVFPLVLFSQELGALLNAGLPLLASLETLAEKEEQPEIKKVLTQIISALYEGHTLSYALEQSPRDFPALYVATVRASEKTGTLTEVLSRYVKYQTQIELVKRKIIHSSIYPVILAVAGALVVLFLMLVVVPRFSHIYEDLGSDLPLMSRLMMHSGLFLEAHLQFILAMLVMAAAAIYYTVTNPASRAWIEQRLWSLPVIGKRLHLYQMARFYRSLGMLLQGGMTIVDALQLVSGLLQVSMRERLEHAATSIREGQTISQAMEKHGLITPLALRLLRVGEQTGRMGEMMERIAAFYEDDMERWTDKFIRMFEPLLMACVGLVIGTIVVLMYFPIFELAGSIE